MCARRAARRPDYAFLDLSVPASAVQTQKQHREILGPDLKGLNIAFPEGLRGAFAEPRATFGGGQMLFMTPRWGGRAGLPFKTNIFLYFHDTRRTRHNCILTKETCAQSTTRGDHASYVAFSPRCVGQK